MQHIIQLGVSFDEKKIQDQLYTNAYGEIVNFLEKKALEELPRSWYGGRNKPTFEPLITDAVNKVIEEYKDQIIQGAIDKVSNSIRRRNAYKEKVEKLEKTYE